MSFKKLLPSNFKVGSEVRVYGTIPATPDRFQVDLSTNEFPDADIVLHFNPRFDQNKVVMNTKERGVWGKEETGNISPFHRGQPFKVTIVAKEEGFRIMVGDQEYYSYRHRMPVTTVKHLHVSGSVQTDSVNLKI